MITKKKKKKPASATLGNCTTAQPAARLAMPPAAGAPRVRGGCLQGSRHLRGRVRGNLGGKGSGEWGVCVWAGESPEPLAGPECQVEANPRSNHELTFTLAPAFHLSSQTSPPGGPSRTPSPTPGPNVAPGLGEAPATPAVSRPLSPCAHHFRAPNTPHGGPQHIPHPS